MPDLMREVLLYLLEADRELRTNYGMETAKVDALIERVRDA